MSPRVRPTLLRLSVLRLSVLRLSVLGLSVLRLSVLLLTVLLLTVLLLEPLSTDLMAGALEGDSAPLLHAENSARARGERIYREGLLGDGSPVQAQIAGSLTVSGTSFTCIHCHLKSGYGASESAVIVRPVTGPKLFAPLFQAAPQSLISELPAGMSRPPLRPAYTPQTLARAITQGWDPSGRSLHPLMPRYRLNDGQVADLILYLQHLSAVPSPAASPETLRLATLVHEDTPVAEAEALHSTLQALFDDHNMESRSERERARTGAFHMRAMSAGWRSWEIVQWKLSGPAQHWEAQLEALQQATPVFALLGAQVPGDFAPVASFADRHRLPNLLPLTRAPAPSPARGYTLYLDGGYGQEGARAARHLLGTASHKKQLPRLLAVHNQGLEATLLHQGFADAWRAGGQSPVAELSWAPSARLPDAEGYLLWLPPAQACDVLRQLGTRWRLPRVVVLPGRLWAEPGKTEASTSPVGRLEAELALPPLPACLPERLRSRLILTWPYALPWESGARTLALSTWLGSHGLPHNQLHIRAQAFFTIRLLEVALKAIREEFYPDYLLDRIDMMPDETYGLATHPRLSFGPGQRVASKGCYLVRPSQEKGSEAKGTALWERVPGTGWVY